jgi:SpoIID/LytB domain protein
MCQWGAIGRARAGQDYKTILTTYYRGTTVAQVNE